MKYIESKISDKINEYYLTGNVVITNFLDPLEQMQASNILKNIPNVIFGGYDEAERKLAFVGADDDFEHFSSFICVIRVTSNEKLNHRNILGSVLGLGIKREMIGDILINENSCDIIVMKNISEYLLNNLKSIGRDKVSVQELEINELRVPIENIKEINASVSSLRVDAIVSAGFGISREKSVELIKGEMVKVNFLEVKSSSKQISVGDVISVRGKGRLEIASIMGNTKSGRIKVLLRKRG